MESTRCNDTELSSLTLPPFPNRTPDLHPTPTTNDTLASFLSNGKETWFQGQRSLSVPDTWKGTRVETLMWRSPSWMAQRRQHPTSGGGGRSILKNEGGIGWSFFIAVSAYPVVGPPEALGPHPHSRKSQALLHHRAGRRRRRERWMRWKSDLDWRCAEVSRYIIRCRERQR